jgi:hypothetical protein
MRQKICAICITRCHRGHRGIKVVHSSRIKCECNKVCQTLYNRPCIAMIPTTRQIEIKREADELRIEEVRFIEQNALTPPVFALVPPVWPDGTPKKWSGWRLCRRPPFDTKLENLGMVEEEDEEDVPPALGKFKNLKIEGGKDEQGKMRSGETPLVRNSFITKSIRWKDDGVDDNSLLTGGQQTPQYVDVSSDSDSNDDEEIKPPPSLLAAFAPSFYRSPLGLPVGWVEAIDPEEPEEIPIGTRVLVTDLELPIKRYGNILAVVRGGVQYKVRLDWGRDDDLREAQKDRIRAERYICIYIYIYIYIYMYTYIIYI